MLKFLFYFLLIFTISAEAKNPIIAYTGYSTTQPYWFRISEALMQHAVERDLQLLYRQLLSILDLPK